MNQQRMNQDLINQQSANKAPVNQEEATAKYIVRMLDEKTAMLDESILGKLANARQQAVAAATGHERAAAVAGRGGLLSLFGDYIHHHRGLMSGAALCGAVLIAFVVTQQMSGQGVSEQGDAFLLSSDLPPEAYADKGFDTWLAQNSQH
ncbi:MAG TPA: DUF3619 family protein [Methylophilaceae bacterium]|nr:DUF3619 family protein [Methylophilaceae bacterium]